MKKTNVRTGGGQPLLNKGFTLIELLAVIVILAIIALIAVPIILNIIDDSKKEAARISAQNYFDAVELAISKEYVKNPNVNLDGTYTISTDGKILTNTNGDKILKVEYEGNSELKIEENNSIITIQKGQVTNVVNVKVGDLYVTVDSGKIVILDKLPTSELISGMDFQMKIKYLIKGSEPQYPFEEHTITKIEFFSNGELPQNKTLDDLTQLKNIDVSKEQNNSIVAYQEGNKIYIYSKNLIKLNENSNSMFSKFRTLSTIKFGNIDTSKVKDMSNMFSSCDNLINLDIEEFDTSKVENMSNMFGGCSSLTALDLSNFNTERVTNMSGMFQWCTNLINLNINKFNTNNVEDMTYFFSNSENILNKYEYYLIFDTSKVKDMLGFFSGYSDSKEIDLSKLETDNVTSMQSMFSGYSSSAPLDLSKLNTSKVTDMGGMFANYSSTTPLDLSGLNTSNVIYMNGMFQYYNSSAPLDLSTLDTGKVMSMSWMFSSYNGPSTLNLSNFKTSNVESMDYMFSNSPTLTSVIVNKNTWITDNANTEGMFEKSQAQLTYVE